MKISTFAPALLVVVAGAAFAQDYPAADKAHPDFSMADTDKDGLLSIAEIQAALPDVSVTDSNADGFVNQSEAEAAVTGLAYEDSGYTGGSSLVSEPEYGLLISKLEGEDSADDAEN